MGEYIGRVVVKLKEGVPDNTGNATVNTLHQLGFTDVLGAETGKLIEVTLTAPSLRSARKQLTEMNAKFFANPVIEEATIESINRTPSPQSQDARRRKTSQ